MASPKEEEQTTHKEPAEAWRVDDAEVAPQLQSIVQGTLAIGRRKLKPGRDLRPTAPVSQVRQGWQLASQDALFAGTSSEANVVAAIREVKRYGTMR